VTSQAASMHIHITAVCNLLHMWVL